MKELVVLGINCSHDAAACVVVNGVVVAAIAEERLSRRKHAQGYPARAIEYCLREAGMQAGLVRPTCVVINQLPPADYERNVLKTFPELSESDIIINPSHHWLHACYARLFLRGVDAVILVADGSGYSYEEYAARGAGMLGQAPPRRDMWESLSAFSVSESGAPQLLLKEWGEWKDYATMRFPSLGHMYSMVATKIFGSWTCAGKVMGLAPYGDRQWSSEPRMVTWDDGRVVVNTDWVCDVPAIDPSLHYENDALARNLAASAQRQLEAVLMRLVESLLVRTGLNTICLTGGVALNSVFNGLLAASGRVNVIVPPAAHDAGTAIGAAVYGYETKTGTLPSLPSDEYLGRCYSVAEVDDAIAARHDVEAEVVEEPESMAARDVADGRIVGWFEGASEFGPRALGHRSILASPRSASTKDRLNQSVKFREAFRPYAAAILREEMAEWFEQELDSPHMLMVGRVREDRRHLVPAVVHVDGTCRIQSLEQSCSSGLRQIVAHAKRLTGVPLVLNTSLNVCGEPLSETPEDAIECLVRSDMDALYMAGRRIVRRADWSQALRRGEALLTGNSAGELRVAFSKCGPTAVSVDQQGRRVRIDVQDVGIVLHSLRGCRMGELAASLDCTAAEVEARVRHLIALGVLRAGRF